MSQQTENQATEVIPPIDRAGAGAEALREKLTDALTPGCQAEFDPDEAARVGAFLEDALSEGDALASTEDLAGLAGELEPGFLNDEGPSADIPPFITTTNVRELYELRPGETVAQAAARKAMEG